jgi:hypothetical protein
VRELNHLLDIEYVTIASYFDDLITEDRGARVAYSELREILDMPSETITAIMQSSMQAIFAKK